MSIKANTIRIGATGSTAIFNDQKLIDLNDLIVDPLENSPESTVVADCTSNLESEYGSSQVTSVTNAKAYKWIWSVSAAVLEKICGETSTILVDDGETKKCKVTIVIQTIVT
ncbi:MAG: hypothetical protein ACI8X5_003342 [Planctomycetota bacterium]|jgi:hypothetical protein